MFNSWQQVTKISHHEQKIKNECARNIRSVKNGSCVVAFVTSCITALDHLLPLHLL